MNFKKNMILLIMILLNMMLISCETSQGGLIQDFFHTFFYEISDNRLLDNKVSIGFGVYYKDTSQIDAKYVSISIYVDNDESPIECLKFTDEELLTEKYHVYSTGPSKLADYNYIIEFNLLKYDIKEFVKIVFHRQYKHDPNSLYFQQLYMKATLIDDDLYIYDYDHTKGNIEK